MAADRVVGYVRVSTDEQADSALGLTAQRRAIRTEVERRGWKLVALHEDAGVSGKSLNRPGIAGALAAVGTGVCPSLMLPQWHRARFNATARKKAPCRATGGFKQSRRKADQNIEAPPSERNALRPL